MSIDFDAFLHADIARENIASSDPPEDEPPPAPVGMEEIDDALLTVELASENVALDNGRATIRRRDEAHDTLMMLIRSALAARDERIAALERTESILRSVANVRTDGTIEQIAALVDADLARRAAEWERMADEVAAANVEATARIAALALDADRLRVEANFAADALWNALGQPAGEIAILGMADAAKERIAKLEAGLRDACDALDAAIDHGDNTISHVKVDMGGRREYLVNCGDDVSRLRALADAGKVGA